MAAKLWSTASVNAFSTTLNGSLTESDNTITLTTVVGLVYPGILVIDRQDANGENTPASREYISYTGISSNTLTGVERGLAGSTAQSHSSGAIIEEVFSVSHWNELIDFLNISHDTAGNLVATSTATLSTARVFEHLNASGASISGSFPIHPTWVIAGTISAATSLVGPAVPMPQSGKIKFFSARTRGNVPANLVLDINNSGTTVFTDQATRLTIASGSDYASTASISAQDIIAGQYLSVDVDSGAGTDIVVLGRIE